MAHFLQKREDRKSEIEPRKRWNIEFPAGGSPYFESRIAPETTKLSGERHNEEKRESMLLFFIFHADGA